ncbi:hypothetical protein WJX79_007029 [Trebouxia sp. C0005]
MICNVNPCLQKLKPNAVRYLAQRKALALHPDSPKWVCTKPDCACAGTSTVVDSASCCVRAVELCSENVTWDEEGKKTIDFINPYLRVQLASTFGLEQGGSCKKSAWIDDHVYACTPDFCITRDKLLHAVSTPIFSGDSVQLYFKDSCDPTAGEWYTGQVVNQGHFVHKAPATLWDSVTVLWEDGSITKEWQKESGDCTTNAREEDDMLRAAPTAEGRKKKTSKVQMPRDHDQPAPSTTLQQPSRRPVIRKAGSRRSTSRHSTSLSARSLSAASRQAVPVPVGPPQGSPPFQSAPVDPPKEAYISPPTPAPVLRTVPSESVLNVIKAFLTPNHKISKSPPGPSRLGIVTHPCYPHGVKWDSVRNKWRVDTANMATGSGKPWVFSDAASAARYHDMHALRRFGGGAHLNFPKEDYMRLPGGSYSLNPSIPSAASEEPISMAVDVEARSPSKQKQPMSLAVMIADAMDYRRRQIFGVFHSEVCANQAEAAAQRLLNGCGNPLPVTFLTQKIARGTPVACPPMNPVDLLICGVNPFINTSPLTTMRSPPWASAHHASSAQPGPSDPTAEPHMGNQTQGPPPPAPPLGARKRLVRKASASAGQAELGRSPARRNPKQQGPATALAEEEEDWDLDAPLRKRAQWGSGPRAGMKSSAAPRASKRSHFKGVTLKNKRIAVMLWSGAQRQPIHLGYWPSSLAAARINDVGRITLHTRAGVDPDQLNFPVDDYTDEEIPDSIEALQDAIKLDQVWLRGASRSSARQAAPQRRQKCRCSQQPARADESAKSATAGKLRISHFLGVSWNRHSSLWQAGFRQSDGTSHFIGHFQKAEAAARAYDEYALKQGGPAAVRNAMPSILTGQPSDDEQAHDCLRNHAVEGDSALLDQAPTKPFPCPAMANGPALANSPALDLASTYVPGPVHSRKRSKAAASAGRGKPGTVDAGYGAGVASHSVPSQPAGAASQAARGASSLGPSTPTRRAKSKRKLPSLSEGEHARVPDSVEVLSSQLLCQSPQLLCQPQGGDRADAPSSQYQGVAWDMQQKQWRVTVMNGRRSIQFGWYSDEEEAACAHDAAAVVIGPQAQLNFPKQNLRMSAATKQMCVDLATGLGLPATLPLSVVDFGWFQDKLEAARSFDAAAVASKQEGCLNFPQQEISVSKAVRQKCVALALHLGHSSSSAHSIGVKRPLNKGKRRPREELTYNELLSATHDDIEQPVLKAAKRGPRATPNAIRHDMAGFSQEEAEAIEALTSLQSNHTLAPRSH